MQVMQQYLIESNTHEFRYARLYQLRDFSILPARRKSIYPAKCMKVDADLSLVRGESSVNIRYECW